MANEMSYDVILRDLKAGNFKPVYVLMGEEPYYIDLLRNAILKYAVPEEDRDLCLSVFYGADTTVGEVINAARSFPMGERLVVVVKNANELKGIEDLAFYLKNPQPTTVLVLTNKGGTFDKRKKFIGMAAKMGVVFESPKVSESKLPPIIAQFFRQRGLAIEDKSVAMMAESIGPDLVRLYGEMNKLADALGGSDQKITPAIVEKYIGISKEFNVFELQNAIIEKNEFKAFQIAKYVDKYMRQTSVHMVLPSLFKLFSQAMVAYYSPSKDSQSLANYLGMQEWQVRRNVMPVLRNYSANKVFAILAAIRDIDEKSKGIGESKASSGDLLRQLIYFILH